MPSVTYKGPTTGKNAPGAPASLIEKAEDGKRYRLRKDVATDVPQDLADRLTGDDGPKGHTVVLTENDQAEATEPAATEPGDDTGGPGGTGSTAAGGTPSTTTGAARTGRGR